MQGLLKTFSLHASLPCTLGTSQQRPVSGPGSPYLGCRAVPMPSRIYGSDGVMLSRCQCWGPEACIAVRTEGTFIAGWCAYMQMLGDPRKRHSGGLALTNGKLLTQGVQHRC